MTHFLKIAVVSLAVLGGVSAAHAGDYDKNKSLIEQIIEDQKRFGN